MQNYYILNTIDFRTHHCRFSLNKDVYPCKNSQLVASRSSSFILYFSGYFNPSPVPDVTNNTYCQQGTPMITPAGVEPPEPDRCFYCFKCSRDYEWYDLRGKGMKLLLTINL